MTAPIWLNLACGTDVRDPPWVNLDVVEKWPLARKACDVIWDARTDGLPYPDGSVDGIYAGYLLLHLGPQHHERVLRDMHRVLRRGGGLLIGEVDMPEVMRRWLAEPQDLYLSGLIWGEQGNLPPCDSCFTRGSQCESCRAQAALADFDKHCQGFSEASLRRLLLRAGFDGRTERTKIHGPGVWYELTLQTIK